MYKLQKEKDQTVFSLDMAAVSMDLSAEVFFACIHCEN